MSTLFSYFSKVETKERSSDTPGVSSCLGNVRTCDNGAARSIKKKRYVLESDGSGEESADVPDGKRACAKSPDGGTAEMAGAMATSLEGKQDYGRSSECNADSPAAITPSRRKSCSTASEGAFAHDKLKWLLENHCKDKQGHVVAHRDYNPKTLLVPPEYFKKLTPGFQQWWKIKADHFDSVVMFKVGKFYELYHMDAVIGVRELGLVFMKAEFAHCGFPEVAFGRYSDSLVQKGYRVVRVEQVETPVMMEQRIKKTIGATRSDRVVRREVCSVITKGTCTFNFLNGDCGNGESVFLLAMKELPITEPIHDKVYGVCFVDTRVGIFHLGQFKDDAESSRLRTLLAHYPPGHVLYEKCGLLPHTVRLIDLLLPSSVKDALVPGMEFWSASKTIHALAEGNYFKDDEACVQWPHALKALFGDSLGLSVAAEFELAASALGACMWCLKRAHIDYSLLSLANFECYNPRDSADSAVLLDENVEFSSRRLILDDITLTNLDVISPDGQLGGTLLEKLDTTVTAFGKRLLRRWVCAPLANISDIGARQDAVEELLRNPSLMAQAKDILCKLPDLERLLRKIHSQGCHAKSKDHPDSRAIFFEHMVYSKRKIADFTSVLDGLRISLKILEIFSEALERSTLLRNLLSVENGRFPDLEEQLTFFENSFDRAKADAEGIIVPNKGVNQKYDTAQDEVKSILEELDQYLIQQRQRLNCKSLTYWGTGRNRFQLQVPVTALRSHKIEEYELTSQRKGVQRYRTPVLDSLFKQLTAAEECRDKCLRDTMENLFYSFDQHFAMWEEAVQCLESLDVLMSLATYSLSAAEKMTRPVLVSPSPSSVLEIRDGQHPCLIYSHSGGEYIPNDVRIEGPRKVVLVTGPNMGGKSTLMRQTGLLVVLAQLGCYVPAAECKLSPVDRVFTRMGACDRIMARESTFFVELKETCSILRHATCHSLVLVDELGRGTATYDGAAIACAVLQHLAQVLRCRTLFSTHYHFIVDQFVDTACIQLGHMACMVEGGDEESITFLYKFTEGACPKSYGFNVAQLAGLPSSVISLARRKAAEYESEAHHVRLLRKLLGPGLCISDLKRLVQ